VNAAFGYSDVCVFSLAFIAFGNIGFWVCDVVGGIFSFMAIINLVRYCQQGNKAPSEQKESSG